MTGFAEILDSAYHKTPGTLGCSFAASDGEMVEFVTGSDTTEWALLTAHYGVLLATMESAFNTKHFGGAEYFIAEHDRLTVLVHTVGEGYFALLAVENPMCLASALQALAGAAIQLRREMR
jgi:hypothetical protein